MATDELDILADTTTDDTGLDNPLLADMTQKEKYDYWRNWVDSQIEAAGGDPESSFFSGSEFTQEDLPYNVDENGVMYNEEGERVYFYQGSQESANATQDNPEKMNDYGDSGYYQMTRMVGDKENLKGLYLTESQIKEQWDSNEMNQFKDAHPNMDWDTYWSYITERQSLIESGELTNGIRPTDEEFWSEQGEWLGDEAFGDDLGNEAYQSLLDKYGIQGKYYDDDGNGYVWNGSGYTKVYDVPKADFRDYAKMAAATGLALIAGPALTNSLTATLGATGAKAASAAIISIASQYATTGEVDLKQALISAAISYGGDKLGEVLKNSDALSGINEQVSNITDTFNEVIEQTGDIGSAAIKAGGMSMLTQLVSTGDIDLKEAAVAAVLGGGIEAFNQFKTYMSDLGVPENEYMADLAEYEEFQQAAIDADIKDPFLNPNYTTVGDGLMVNASGVVFNYAGDNLGNMSTLDTNNDGMLSGVDLQEITTDVEAKNIYNYQMGDTVYVDENGVAVDPKLVKRSGDGFVGYDAAGNEVTVTEKYYNEVFGGSKGDLVWTSEGGTDGYISYENGELAYKKVEGQWVDAEGNVVDDPQTVDELTMVAAKAIDEPLESVEYFDQSGNPITYKYPPAGLQDNFEQGQFSGLIFGPNGEINEVWYDPVTNTEYVKAQGTTEITAIRTPDTPPEPVDPTKVTEVTKTTTSGGQEVANNTADAIATATNTNQINETIAAASQQGASASQLANAINAAVAAGTISAEQAAAALGAIDVTASVDRSTTSISTGAGGMLTGGAGTDVNAVTTGNVTTGSDAGAGGETDDIGGGNTHGGIGSGADVTGTKDTGTGDTGTVDTGTGDTGTKDTGTGTKNYSTAITGALGGAITTVAGTGDAGTGDTGTGDPGTGGPGTGGPPGINGKDGKDGRDGVSSRPFTPYEFKGLSYQTPTVQDIVQSPNVDYMASLDRIINKGMFGNLI